MRFESTLMVIPGVRFPQPRSRAIRMAGIIALAAGLAVLSGCNIGKRSSSAPSEEIIANTDPNPEPVVIPEVTEWPYAETPPVPDGYDVRKQLLDVTFPAGSAALDAEARGALGEAIDQLKTNSAWHALVVGFSDGKNESGALARTRAEAVSKILASRGIDASRVSVLGLGSAYAKAGEFEPEQLTRDRRAEIWVFAD